MPLSSPGGARTNTYPMDSAHQRYRLIHYNCFIHISPQLHTVHAKGIGLFTTIALFMQVHNCTQCIPKVLAYSLQFA